MRWRRSSREDESDAEPANGRGLTGAISSLAPPLLDAWLLKQFPGRTLEELDRIDFPRLWRAQRAAEVDRVEGKLPEFFAGKWQPTAEEWQIIVQNDRLVADA